MLRTLRSLCCAQEVSDFQPSSTNVLAEIHAVAPEYAEAVGAFTRAKADKFKALQLDRTELAAKKLPDERLDQLTIDILLGVRA